MLDIFLKNPKVPNVIAQNLLGLGTVKPNMGVF